MNPLGVVHVQVAEGSGEAHLEGITGVEAFLFQCEIRGCKAKANREIDEASHEINHLMSAMSGILEKVDHT